MITAVNNKKYISKVQLQVGGGDCAEVTLVKLEVILRGLVIGQDVAIEPGSACKLVWN